GLGCLCTPQMDDCGELLLVLRVELGVLLAGENVPKVAVQINRRKLDRVARQYPSREPGEPAAVRDDNVTPDAKPPRLGESCSGHLEHADPARSWLVESDGIPAQPPTPISSRHRISRPLNLRQRRKQFGCNSGRRILAKQR